MAVGVFPRFFPQIIAPPGPAVKGFLAFPAKKMRGFPWGGPLFPKEEPLGGGFAFLGEKGSVYINHSTSSK